MNNITDREILESIEKHKLHISPGINNVGWLVSRYGEEFELKYEPHWNSTKQSSYRKIHPACGTCGDTLVEAISNILDLIKKVDEEVNKEKEVYSQVEFGKNSGTGKVQVIKNGKVIGEQG